MVDKKLVVISYLCTFLLIYFCAIAYVIAPTVLNKGFHANIDVPKSASIDTAYSAVAEINITTLGIILLIILIIIVTLSFMSSFFMFGAY